MSINISSDDYIMVRHRNRPTLCFVLNPRSKQAVVEKSLATDEPENIKYEEKDVLCNLGPMPAHGKLYGVDVMPYERTIKTKKYGPILFFTQVPKDDLKKLQKAMSNMYDAFSERASTDFLPVSQIRICPKKGKYAGSYSAKQKYGVITDTIHFHPDDFSDQQYNEYLVAHEFAHALWFRCVEQKIRAKWIVLYQKRLKLSSVDHYALEAIYKELIEYEGTIRDYMKEVAGDEDKLLLREILSFFRKYHSMTPDDVELLFQYDSGKLVEMWPTVATLSELRPDISTYSLKNVQEFFAEAVAYTLTGKILPKDVSKAIKHTFSSVRLSS